MLPPGCVAAGLRRAALAALPLGSLTLGACARQPVTAAAPAAITVDSAAFVTRLGADTLAVERFVRTPRRLEADVILRVPTTTRTRYLLELGPGGEMTRFEAMTTHPRATTPDALPLRRELVLGGRDSLLIETTADGKTRTRSVAAGPGVLPFIDMVHWPYEVALVRARGAAGGAVALPPAQPLLTGARVQDFPLAMVGADSVTITHPLRGTMRARVDASGRLLGLDAGATTRKLTVERRPWMPIDALVERWTALDAAGRSVGALSGRAEETATIGGATVTVDYGTPAKRGRAIWGALVPYGAVWRTGANQATQLSTDRDLVLGTGTDTLLVPAGQYSLFSIPAADGGVLIVNRQTNQAGTAYDAAHDLGRVRMTARPIGEMVELFTIDVAPVGSGGELRLRWDREERAVAVKVRG